MKALLHHDAAGVARMPPGHGAAAGISAVSSKFILRRWPLSASAGSRNRGPRQQTIERKASDDVMIGCASPASSGRLRNIRSAASRTTDWSFYREAFPIPKPTDAERGQERFDIFCAVCHDRLGAGKGMIVERGFTAPPSLHTDWSRGFKRKGANLKLRDAPIGYYFEVITHGFGAMPDHAEQVAPDDRWAIIAYIRALQLSQNRSLEDIRDETERTRSSRQRSPA